jgi:transcriptional regulator with XRE-family HTH domain
MMTSVSARLRAIRRHLGFSTRAQMAERLRLPASTYNGYESEQGPPKVEWLTELAAMGVDINWLLLGVGEMMQGCSPEVTAPVVIDDILLAAMIHTVERREQGAGKPLSPQEKSQLVARLYTMTLQHAAASIPQIPVRQEEASARD